MSAAHDLAPLVEAVAAEIGKLRAALRSGGQLDMQRLAALIEEAHASAVHLGSEEAAAAKLRFVGLLADLDGLQAEMKAAHASIEAELRGATARHRAVNAYGRPPGR